MNAFNPVELEVIAERKRNSNSSVKKQRNLRVSLQIKIESRIDDLLMKRLESNAIQVG